MKSSVCYKILILVFINLSLSTSAMQHFSSFNESIRAKDVKTVLTTAAILSCCYGVYWKLVSMNNETKPDTSRKRRITYPHSKIAQMTMNMLGVCGIPLGLMRVCSEHYGSWPQADSMKPFIAALAAASLVGFYKGFLEKDEFIANNSLRKSKKALNHMIRFLVPGLYITSAWTVYQRYHLSKST